MAAPKFTAHVGFSLPDADPEKRALAMEDVYAIERMFRRPPDWADDDAFRAALQSVLDHHPVSVVREKRVVPALFAHVILGSYVGPLNEAQQVMLAAYARALRLKLLKQVIAGAFGLVFGAAVVVGLYLLFFNP